VTERYSFAGPAAIDYEAVLEDPETFSAPWRMSFRLYRLAGPDPHLLEFKCVEFTEDLLYGQYYKSAVE